MIRFLQNQGPAKKIVLSSILALVCVSMVVYLIPGFMSNDASTQDGVIATVDGDSITTQQVLTRAQQIGRQQFQGRAVPPMFMPYLAQRAMNDLIMQKLLNSEAERLGLRATDDEVSAAIRTGFKDILYVDGKFVGREQYEAFVNQQFNMTIKDFEEAIRSEIVNEKLQNVILDGVSVTQPEIERSYREDNTAVKFQYAVLDGNELAKQINPSDAELKAYYDNNKAKYENSIPEKRKVTYALLENSKVDAQVTREDLDKVYRQNIESYRVPAQVDVRHILISVPAGADQATDDKAKAKAQELVKQLKAGADFAALAKQHSEDPGSKDNGGLYENINRGAFVPEFDQVSFSAPIGQISDPVKTNYGYHIIKVDRRQDARVRPLDEVKAELEPMAKSQKHAEVMQATANKIADAARTGSLDKAAAANGLQTVKTDFFTRNTPLPGLGFSQQLMESVFGAQAGSAPQAVNVPQGFVIFQVNEVKPAATPSFEEIRGRVTAEFRNERAQTLLQNKTRELTDLARSKHDLAAAAKEVGATLKTSEKVKASDNVPDIGSMDNARVAFTLKPGEISSPIMLGSKGVVIALQEREEPSMEGLAAEQDQIRDRIQNEKRSAMYQMFAGSLRERMEKDGKLKINKNEVDRIARTARG